MGALSTLSAQPYWIQKSPLANPPARADGALAYDAARGQVVLFGGMAQRDQVFFDFGDTWVWDGTNWTQKTPLNSPSARHGFAVAYDTAHAQVVLYGGTNLDASVIYPETWVWDGTNWTQKITLNGPSGPVAMAYDSAHGQGVLVNAHGETWVWDGTNWTQEHPQNSPMPRMAR
jgi:hypothetical protein